MNWIEIGHPAAVRLMQKEGAVIVCLFDTGVYGFLSDPVWPFAEVTHILEIIKP